MKVILFTVLSLATSQAMATVCSIGADTAGSPVLMSGGQVVETRNDVLTIVADLKQMIAIGACTPAQVKCSVSADTAASPIVTVNGQTVATFNDINKGIETFTAVHGSGICADDKKSVCAIGADTEGSPVLTVDTVVVATRNDLSAVMDIFKAMKTAGVCK